MPLNNRTVAIVDIVEAKAREQKMVTVQASDMEKAIAGTGRIALYGIYFDFNKADIKPESDPTLEQIAQLLKQIERHETACRWPHRQRRDAFPSTWNCRSGVRQPR